MFRRSRRLATETLEEAYAVEQSPSLTGYRAEHDHYDPPLPEEVATDAPVALAASGLAEPLAASSLPAEESRASTVIGPATVIDGAVRTPEDLRVEGGISGTIEVGGALTVDRGGSVDAAVDAQTVLVRGRLHGDVQGRRRLEVTRGGHAEGTFRTETLVIEEGAIVHGRFSMGGDAIEAPAHTDAEEAI